jgi:hypothetical protein
MKLPAVVVACCLGWSCVVAQAAGRVDAEIAIEPGFNATDLRFWSEMLSGVGVDNLQLGGSANNARRVGVEPVASGGATNYRVFGVISNRGELVLPGGRYGRGDRAKVAQWIAELKTTGLPRKPGEKPAPFGLPPEVLTAISNDLTQPVDFDTKGLTPAKVLATMSTKLKSQFMADPAVARELGAAEKVPGELKGLSCGTAAAAILRREGLSLVPRLRADGKAEYYVTKAGPTQDVWPIGWPPERSLPEITPELFTLRNVEIDDIPASQLLQVVADRTKLPMLFDEQALVLQRIDPSKVKIKIPLAKIGYEAVLTRTLFQANLKHEVRVDDAGRPFLWITTR